MYSEKLDSKRELVELCDDSIALELLFLLSFEDSFISLVVFSFCCEEGILQESKCVFFILFK